MLKRILAVVALCITASAQAQNPDTSRLFVPGPLGVVLQVGRWIMQDQDLVYEVTVQGVGDTAAQAQDQAYRTAVHQTAGALVLTQSQVSQTEVRRNDTLVYSSGFVDRFEVLKHTLDARGRVVVDMRVWIRRSTIADGLFGASVDTDRVDGARISASARTLRQERTDGDRILDAVLREFPARSFRVNIVKTGWTLDHNRNPSLAVEFALQWHEPWINSLREVMKKTTGVPQDHACGRSAAQCRRDGLAYVAVQLRPGTHGVQQVAAWPDRPRLDLVHGHLVGQGLSLTVQLMTLGGEVLHRECVRPAQIQDTGWGNWLGVMQPTNQGVDIWAWARNTGRVLVRNVPDWAIARMDRVEISVVRDQDCG